MRRRAYKHAKLTSSAYYHKQKTFVNPVPPFAPSIMEALGIYCSLDIEAMRASEPYRLFMEACEKAMPGIPATTTESAGRP